jgi:hypothetical protein
MSDGNAHETDWVVLAEPVRRRRRLGGLFATAAPRFELQPEADQYLVTLKPDGQRELRLITSSEQLRSSHNCESAILCRVRKRRQQLSLSFSRILEDANGSAWDVLIEGAWWVSDARSFLSARAAAVVSPEVPLAGEMGQTWLGSVVRSHVYDAVKAHTIEELRDRDALPASWWSKQMNDWLDATGLGVEVLETSWTSADATLAEAERCRLEDLARVEAEQHREHEAVLRREKLESEYAEHRRRIEHDQKLSALERERELQLEEQRHRAELLKLETEIEETRQRKERAAAEHDLAVAKLKNDLQAVQEAEERQAKMQTLHAETVRVLADTKAALERLAGVPELLQKLVDRDARQAHQTAERILSPEFAALGVSADMLMLLGYRVPVQSAWQFFSDRARKETDGVKIEKDELRTRDIGVAKVKALKIGTSLAFSFTSARSGFVTMMNLGTSGRVCVHVPSALCQPESARVEAGRRYTVPGPELFPWPDDYREEGPGGWEHIVLIVSDEPLVTGGAVRRASAESPLVELATNELEQLLDRLENLRDAWSVGLLSFLVEAT